MIEEISTSGRLKNEFLYGTCDVFAVALYRLTNLPIHALIEKKTNNLVHAYVKKDNNIIDAKGIRSFSSMLKDFSKGNEYERRMTEKSIIKTGHGWSISELERSIELKEAITLAKKLLQ